MPIPETQLATWSHQGTVPQSSLTYQAIKSALEDPKAPYASKTPSVSVYRQGSYENDTNVRSESDVDVVCQLDDTYFADTSALSPDSQTSYTGAFVSASYGYYEFRTDVLSWLQTNFGATVSPGKKAIHVPGNGYRRDADVLVCCSHRRYWSGSTGTDGLFDAGVSFFAPGYSYRIDNFPKQHSANCTAKHQGINLRFKPTVRVFKNMRNRMIEEGFLSDGIAPSYFIEGMLWNLPPEHFRPTFFETIVKVHGWLEQADEKELACASDLHYLVRDGLPVCWPTANCRALLKAIETYWNRWGV